MNSDQQLIQNYLESQSQEAFSELVDRYVRLVWATASRVTQSSLHADDITQQTFLLLAKKANQLVDASNLAGWLHRTTYLLALNQRRADQRRLAHHREAHQIMSNDSTSTDSWREIAPQLDACLQALSERERSFLLMRFFRNFKWSQVAQFHQISEGAAKMQVQRSLQKLRRQLQRSGVLVSSLSLYAGLHANAAPPLEINSLHLVRTAIANRLSGQKGFSGFVRDRGGTLVIASAIIVISFFLGYRGWFHGNGGGPSSYLRGGEGRLEVRMEGDASTLLSRSQPTVAAYRPSVPSAEQALRNAIYNRDLLNGPSCQALEAALKLFGMDGDRAVSILLEALVVPLESSNWGRVVTDTYFVGKEHHLALHGLRILGPSARSAVGTLLERINQDEVYLHYNYPRTLRALDPDPEIVPALIDAMDTRFYVRNVMGRELSEFVADLVKTDLSLSEQARIELGDYLEEQHPTLRVTAAYALALLGQEDSERVGPELESHLRAFAIASSQDPPHVETTQDFMKGVMRQATGLGDTEGRRRLAILGLRALGHSSEEAFDELKLIAQTSPHKQTQSWAFDALNAVDPDLRSSLPSLGFYLDDQSKGNHFKQLIEADKATSTDLVDALEWPISRLAATESIRRQGAEASWAIPFLVSTFDSSDGAYFSEVASTLSEINPRALLEGLKSENLSAIERIGTVLASYGPSAAWAFDALDEVRQNIPYKSHGIEKALRNIAPDRYHPLPELNILEETVSLFQYSQSNSQKTDHGALWRLLSQIGPRLSSLPEPGVSILIERVSAIDRKLGEVFLKRMEERYPDLRSIAQSD